jgi:hypothetical protein
MGFPSGHDLHMVDVPYLMSISISILVTILNIMSFLGHVIDILIHSENFNSYFQ